MSAPTRGQRGGAPTKSRAGSNTPLRGRGSSRASARTPVGSRGRDRVTASSTTGAGLLQALRNGSINKSGDSNTSNRGGRGQRLRTMSIRATIYDAKLSQALALP